MTVFQIYGKAARRQEAKARYTDISNLITAIAHSFGGKGTKDLFSDLEDEMEQD